MHTCMPCSPLEVVPYEEVVKGLAADTVATSSSLGYRGRRFSSGQYSQAVFITIKVGALMTDCNFSS